MRPNDTPAPGFSSSSPSQVSWYRTIVPHLQSIQNNSAYFAAGDTSVGFTPLRRGMALERQNSGRRWRLAARFYNLRPEEPQGCRGGGDPLPARGFCGTLPVL